MKKVCLLFLCLFSLSVMAYQPTSLLRKDVVKSVVLKSTFAPKDDFKKHFEIKMNLAGLLINNISLQGEFAFHKNVSIALGFSYMIPKGLPAFVTSAIGKSNAELANTVGSTKLSGYAITPELRIYPGPKTIHQAPYGFYFAPYMRFNNYTINSKPSFSNTDPATNVTTNYTGDMSLGFKGIGGGLMIGSQWVIGKHVTVDWWILGLQYMSTTFTGKVTTASATNAVQANADAISNQLKSLPLFGAPTVTTNGGNIKVDFPSTGLPGVRAGLTLGFMF